MKIQKSTLVLFGISFLLVACSAETTPTMAGTVAPAPNGILMPQGYKDWRVLSVSHRTDNKTLRVILGNDIAMQAARNGVTNPWPKGAILGKVVWKDIVRQEDWPTATVPGQFAAAEFMKKDAQKFEKTGGWGYSRWLGDAQIPYGKDENFAQECYACHIPMKDNDYVFTRPVKLP